MVSLRQIGIIVAEARTAAGFRQIDLAAKAGVSRATLDALENGRASEIGVSKLARLLNSLGLEIAIRPANRDRPTLDELLNEDADD